MNMAQPFGRKLKSCSRFFASRRLGGECGVPCFNRQDAKGQLVCLVAASFFFLSACSEKEAPPPKPVVPVAVSTAVLKDVPIQLNAIGTVEANSTVIVKT